MPTSVHPFNFFFSLPHFVGNLCCFFFFDISISSICSIVIKFMETKADIKCTAYINTVLYIWDIFVLLLFFDFPLAILYSETASLLTGQNHFPLIKRVHSVFFGDNFKLFWTIYSAKVLRILFAFTSRDRSNLAAYITIKSSANQTTTIPSSIGITF